VEFRNTTDGAQWGALEERHDEESLVAFSPDGQTLASGSHDHAVRLWRFSDGSLIHVLEGHRDDVYSVAFSPDGKTLASGSRDAKVQVWRAADGHRMHVLDEHRAAVETVAFGPNGETLASGSLDGTVRLWRLSDGIAFRILKEHDNPPPVNAVAFASNGMLIATGSWDGTVGLWSIAEGNLFRAIMRPDGRITAIDFTPDGESIASRSVGAIRLSRLSDGKFIRRFEDSGGSVIDGTNHVAFAPDGKTMVANAHDGTVKLWRVSDGEVIRSFDKRGCFLWSVKLAPDNRHLVAACNDGLRIWRSDKEDPILRLVAVSGHDAQITLSGSSQYFDLAGRDRDWAFERVLICRIGPVALPVEACAERAYVPGLWVKAMSGAGMDP
jgi:WD40 repeat protein